MQVLGLIELQRNAITSDDIRLEVDLSADYSLLIDIEIRYVCV